MQYDVLISYSAQEREMVERLAAYLEYYNVRMGVPDAPNEASSLLSHTCEL